jgi:hypothetical protein
MVPAGTGAATRIAVVSVGADRAAGTAGIMNAAWSIGWTAGWSVENIIGSATNIAATNPIV